MPRPASNRLADSRLFAQRLAEPRPGILPVAVGDRPGMPQDLARLIDGEPAEQGARGAPRRRGVLAAEAVEQVVQRQDEVLGEGAGVVEQFDAQSPAPAL